MYLIVGLGNPGSEYQGTRHNVGFEVIEAVAQRLGWCEPGKFDKRAKKAFDSLVLEGVIQTSTGYEKLILQKPQTYMNLSGRSVQAAVWFYKLVPERIVVVLDELALPCGTIRLRKGGSDGGHNGLKSIQQSIGTKDYPRLRIGIDSAKVHDDTGDGPRIAGSDYVLGRFTPPQRPLVEKSIASAAGCLITFVDHGIDKAMNQYNVKEVDR